MVERKEYIDELIGWKDEQVIKVVTGIHRCGKSTLLAQYQTWLKENGIADAQIVSINFEELPIVSRHATSSKPKRSFRLSFQLRVTTFSSHPSGMRPSKKENSVLES